MNRIARMRARHADAIEHKQRRAARRGHCYMCALSGWTETATHGELCERHFSEVDFPRIEII